MQLFLDAFITSLIYAALFSLAALGLNLIFGVMRIVNLAHGQFIVFGSYAAILLLSSYSVNPLMALLFIVPVFFLAGIPLYYLLIPRLRKSGDPEMSSFILFFGLSFIMEGLAIQFFGVDYRTLPYSSFRPLHVSIAGSTIPFAWVVTAAVSVLFILVIYAYLYHTRLGLQTRALMINRDEAAANGVNAGTVSAIAFSTGVTLAAIAGAFSSFISYPTSPDIGATFTLISFAIIIIGALGNPLATLAGGVVFAFAYGYTELYLPNISSLVPFVVLIAIILVRPTGLLGRKVREF